MKTLRKLGRAIEAIPDVYMLQPKTDYQVFVSHSAEEVARKAWGKTGTAFARAMKKGGNEKPAKRKEVVAA